MTQHSQPIRISHNSATAADHGPARISGRIQALRPTVRPYDRRMDLPGLMPLWPAELKDGSLAGRTGLVDRLKRALRQERQRGRSGHWTYDLNRHAALLAAYRAESAAVAVLRASLRVPSGGGSASPRQA
jgi:hypothetical protein